MIIVIDGYNLLKQIFPGAKKNLDKQKVAFIRQLAYYKAKKSREIKEIVVVFDAGPSNHATREVKSGIVVVYSGVKSSADSWILNFVERNKGKDLLIVTLDRALREACKKIDADSMCVYEFYTILQQNLMKSVAKSSQQQAEGILEKYEPLDVEDIDQQIVDPQVLDMLMEQASLQQPSPKKIDLIQEASEKKGNAHMLTKAERRMQAKLKRLL